MSQKLFFESKCVSNTELFQINNRSSILAKNKLSFCTPRPTELKEQALLVEKRYHDTLKRVKMSEISRFWNRNDNFQEKELGMRFYAHVTIGNS